MQKIAPYINFQGRAREAMELYHSILGGKLELYAADETGQTRPAQPGDRIQHARLAGDGFLLIGSDGHPKYPTTAGDNMAVGFTRPTRQARPGPPSPATASSTHAWQVTGFY